jgi:hypothetical protein
MEPWRLHKVRLDVARDCKDSSGFYPSIGYKFFAGKWGPSAVVEALFLLTCYRTTLTQPSYPIFIGQRALLSQDEL